MYLESSKTAAVARTIFSIHRVQLFSIKLSTTALKMLLVQFFLPTLILFSFLAHIFYLFLLSQRSTISTPRKAPNNKTAETSSPTTQPNRTPSHTPSQEQASSPSLPHYSDPLAVSSSSSPIQTETIKKTIALPKEVFKTLHTSNATLPVKVV